MNLDLRDPDTHVYEYVRVCSVTAQYVSSFHSPLSLQLMPVCPYYVSA